METFHQPTGDHRRRQRFGGLSFRRVVTKAITVERAAKVDRVPVDELLETLNTAVQQIEQEGLNAENRHRDVPATYPRCEMMGTVIGQDGPRGGIMANKDKGGRSTKKVASKSLKEKRQAKKAKKV